MVQTSAGAKKAVATVRERWGESFYKMVGARGGRNSHNGGYASEKVGADGLTGRERARVAGAKGGRISRRTGIKNHEGKKWKKIQELNGEV